VALGLVLVAPQMLDLHSQLLDLHSIANEALHRQTMKLDLGIGKPVLRDKINPETCCLSIDDFNSVVIRMFGRNLLQTPTQLIDNVLRQLYNKITRVLMSTRIVSLHSRAITSERSFELLLPSEMLEILQQRMSSDNQIASKISLIQQMFKHCVYQVKNKKNYLSHFSPTQLLLLQL